MSTRNANSPFTYASTLGSYNAGMVGSLPTVEFINVIIGVIIIVICLPIAWFWLSRLIKQRTSSREENGTDTLPLFLKRKPQHSYRFESIIRNEVRDQRSSGKYTISETSVIEVAIARPSLPLPVPTKKETVILAGDNLTIQIDEVGKLIDEKEKLDITIVNLQRIEDIRKLGGKSSTWKLEQALMKRRQVETSIANSFQQFSEKKESWSEDEWRLIEEIRESLHL